MKNLLRDAATVEELRACLARHRAVRLLPPFGAPEWRTAFAKPPAGNWLAQIRALAVREETEPLPVLTDKMYALFHQTGDRVVFERAYFERRRRLGRATICALAEGARWLPSVVAKLREIFAEESWSVPAHVKALSGKDPDVLDLFGSETANVMAEMLTLFPAELPVELGEAIRARLRSQVFENYLQRNYWWMTAAWNWNGVCHQGILGAALGAERDEELVARMLMRMREFLPTFLTGFTPDGGSSEGPGYWQYGFGWFSELNQQLEARTGGEWSLFEGDEHVRVIAQFGPRLTLANGNLVNFADGPATGRLSPSLLQYLADRLAEPTCRQLAAENWHQLATNGLNLRELRCDVFYLTHLFLRCPAEVPAVNAVPPPDVWLPDLAVLVARSRDERGNLWELAVKGGHNAEHHNHNDCGSYLLNVNGERLIIEIGAPEYTKAFFSEQRYEFLAARTLGHSLPIINGCEQLAGREFAAQVVEQTLDAKQARLVLDLTACYGPAADCAWCVRTIQLDKRAGRLAVRDEFELRTVRAVETAIITTPDALTKFVIQPGPATLLRAPESHQYSGHGGVPHSIHRVVLCPRQLTDRLTLEYSVSLTTDHL